MIIDELVIKNTLVDYPRLDKIEQYVKATEHLPGVIAEIGVYQGGTARLIVKSTKKDVYLFDTFEGMPETLEIDTHKRGKFSDTSVNHVHSVLTGYKNYWVVQGICPKDNPLFINELQFSLVHIDVDIYTSVKECLAFFYPRMVPGGIIILDDYNADDCQGAKLATDEFLKANKLSLKEFCQCQAILLK